MAQAAPQARTTRVASPARWQRAAERALAEGIEVRQVNASGMWVATSGTQANVAYLLEITGTLVQSCSCPAGSFGDPCCKHAARYYLNAGLLEIDNPEPDPPALGVSVDCPECHGCGVIYDRDLERAGWLYPPCAACTGTGLTQARTSSPAALDPFAVAA
jgi:SWIM zinc finger